MTNAEQQLVEFCQALIRTPSLSGQEEQVARLIQKTMLQEGFDEAVIDRYGSVLGCIRGNRPGKTVLLDGHIDTVDLSDRSLWQHDPYGAELVDGKIYGRGTSDMKGSVAAMVMAAAGFAKAHGHDFSGTIYVSCTVHEECFEGVSSRNITKLCHPDCVIVGEATSTTLKIGQRGRAEVVLETKGKSCHSSNPDEGVNAVYLMTELIQEIRKLSAPEHPVLGKGILELTDIVSSPYPGSSVVPEYCRATFDRRLLVGETERDVLQPLEELIARVQARIPALQAKAYLATGTAPCWTGDTIEAPRFFPAWLLPEDHWLVRSVSQGLQEAGIEAPISHYDFCTNGSHFCGEAQIPTVGFGPSLETLGHVIDEYIEVTQLTRSYHGFISILEKLTGLEKPCA